MTSGVKVTVEPDSASCDTGCTRKLGGAGMKLTSSTHTRSDPLVSAKSFAYSHCTTVGPGGMVTTCCCQLTLPEICTCITPFIRKRRKSAFGCVEVRHQYRSVPGPVTVVRIHVEWPLST